MSEQKLAQGVRFGQWTLQGNEPLGKGGNGVVWAARDLQGETAAIKFLHRHHFGTIRTNRFFDEIAFLKNESGRSGILPIIDANTPAIPSATNRPWFVTPLARPFSALGLSGASHLPDLIRKTEVIARTLASLHDEQKWHRDLKPDNLFLLNDDPVVGDFGLVDFPNKDAVTANSEFLGPLFYIAPEMMSDAAEKQAGPADVYSMAKTLWVLASGQRYPQPGEQRVDIPALRLSTYCPHPDAKILDGLLERATSHDPTRRPTMREVSEELTAWLKLGTRSPDVRIDLESLAKEYRVLFEPGIRVKRSQDQLIEAAKTALVSFDHTLEQLSSNMHTVTGIVPVTTEAIQLHQRLHFVEHFRGQRSVWRRTRSVSVTVEHDRSTLIFRAFVQVEAISDERIRTLVGYLVQPSVGGELIISPAPWTKENIAVHSTAAMENGLAALQTDLVANFSSACRLFAERVRNLQK